MSQSGRIRKSLRILLVLSAMLPQLAMAGDDCKADVANAHARIAAIQARDPKIDALMKRKNVKAVCAILKINVTDMTVARDSLALCLEGFDRNEEVAALNANLADLSGAIGKLCK